MNRRDTTPIRVAVMTSLYPNREQPRHGVFVEERLRQLVATGSVEARVVAPVPWFFSTHSRFGTYARMAAVPPREVRYGIVVEHPRYLVIPRVGMRLSPLTMARSAISTLVRWRREGFAFDLIDSHYFYPDGVAAVRVGARLDRPVVITARGSDLNRIAELPAARARIRTAAERADGVITVSKALASRLRELGVAQEHITVLRNGVDTERFAPLDRAAIRRELGLDGTVWLCVGHLTELKGQHLAIEALSTLDETLTLLIAGDGPEDDNLRRLAGRLGVADRVRFLGAIDHDDLPRYFNAADALIHPARMEGMPNVVLEAIACGCAVVATDIGGIPEVVTGLPVGRLMSARTPEALRQAWAVVRDQSVDAASRQARRDHAKGYSWDATSAGQIELFHDIVQRRAVSG